MNSYQLSEFDFEFPPQLIALRTAGKGQTRILHCSKNGSHTSILKAPQILDLLKKGDCIVVNNTKVFPARLFGKTPFGGQVEALLVQALNPSKNGKARFEALVKPGRAFSLNKSVFLAGVFAEVENILEDGTRILRFEITPQELEKLLEKEGHIPLPPYIQRPDDQSDKEAYQSIFAKQTGAVAAPTASLHFSQEMLNQIKEKGVSIAEVTLHVGPGTFQNINTEDFREHQMHGEHYELTEKNAQIINETKERQGRVIAIGTTSTRVLETIASEDGRIQAQKGLTRAFIYPGYRYKITDGLLTNFHWPKSSLILLVAAFYGKENTLAAYQKAIENQMQLFSYGDGMLIL